MKNHWHRLDKLLERLQKGTQCYAKCGVVRVPSSKMGDDEYIAQAIAQHAGGLPFKDGTGVMVVSEPCRTPEEWNELVRSHIGHETEENPR